ncbi:MAG: hypothetical protein M3326_12600 [Actinomycetota bacterium]|nr:hypothetical protein [Actinomycetota bacterium]
MRTSKYVGFLGIGLGALLVVGAAVLPISPSTERFGPFRIGVGADNCGPAGVVAVRTPDTECGAAARRRLLSTSAVGLLVVALGMALFAGDDGSDHSRVDVRSRRVKRRSPAGSPGSRRYRPG